MGTEPPHNAPSIDGSRLCVTGGAGFIGAALTRRLLELGASVAVIDDLSASSMAPVAALLDDFGDRFDFIHASVLEPRALAAAVSGASIVYHLAAVSAVDTSADDPDRVFDVNAAGTQRVAEAARLAGAARLVYASSCAAYGRNPVPHDEAQPPDPLSVYAASKLAGEHAVTAYANSMGLPAVSLRFFNVYGPGQPAAGAVIPAFIEQTLAAAAPVVQGDGAQTRDFIHVADAVRALLAAATKPADNPGPLNIGTGTETSIRDLAALILKLAGRQHEAPAAAPPRKGDVPRSRAAIERAAAALGFTADITLEQGLESLLEDARRQDPDPAPSA